jgi:hypothetical protein
MVFFGYRVRSVVNCLLEISVARVIERRCFPPPTDDGWPGSDPDYLTLNPPQETSESETTKVTAAVFKWTPANRAVFKFFRHKIQPM